MYFVIYYLRSDQLSFDSMVEEPMVEELKSKSNKLKKSNKKTKKTTKKSTKKSKKYKRND